MSGIAGVYYTIGEYNPRTLEELNQAIKDGRAKKINCEISKNVDFSLAITNEMKGQIIKVYVIDNAGNFRVASTINSGDNDIPKLKNIELVSITKNGEYFEESTAHKKHSFGSEKLQDSYPFTKFYYASDVSYLKFNVIEEHQDDVIITVSVSGGKSVTFNASEMCKITNEGEEINFPYSFKADEVVNANSVGIRISEKNDIETYYIPIKAVAEKLELTTSDDENVYQFFISASDGKYNHKTDENNPLTIEDVYYNPSDANDSRISIVLSETVKEKPYEISGLDDTIDAYFYRVGENSNTLDISFSDDVGISNYEIELVKVAENGEEATILSTTVDLSGGIERIGTYTVTTVATNAEGEEVVTVATETEPYKERATKSETDTIPITMPEQIVFSEDGYYKLRTTLTDLEGNKNIVEKNYIVDTVAPVIEDFNYKIRTGFLHYLTFGIYGSEKIELAIKVSDGIFMSSGVLIENIKLFWDGEEYSAHEEDGWYVFNILSPVHNDTPYIKITDRMEHSNKYYFSTIDDAEDEFWSNESTNTEFEKNLVLNDEKSGVTLVLEDNSPEFTVIPIGSNFKTDLGDD